MADTRVRSFVHPPWIASDGRRASRTGKDWARNSRALRSTDSGVCGEAAWYGQEHRVKFAYTKGTAAE
jgi:hypothetical protein